MEISKKTRGLRRACDAAAMLEGADLTLGRRASPSRWPAAPKALPARPAGRRRRRCHQPFSVQISEHRMSAAPPVYNFSAGPACLPASVLLQVQAELLDFQNTGARAAAPCVFFPLENCTEISRIPLAGVQAQVSWKCRTVPPSLSRLPTMPQTTFAISCASAPPPSPPFRV